MDIKHKYYQTNGIQLHVAEAGPQEGKTILFLHGFPEFWYGWKNQLKFFSEKGWHALAPDQRGYNLSSKPEGVQSYTIDELTKDIVELIPQLTTEKMVLVGHDWGGGVAWNLALHHPQLFEKLVILNMPHPQVAHEHLTKNPKQMLRSWYAGFFQIPWIPEAVNSSFDFKVLESTLKGSAQPDTFTKQDIEAYKEAWKQPGAMQAMINWYRAYKDNKIEADHQVDVPTLMLWGKQDQFLGTEMALPSIEQCTNGQLFFLENATHWVHHEQPDKVNAWMENFLKA
ncbi:alpha/beta fold hydrolase [Rufibacter latericius]|uniref:Alpha/beta hydrolase n=1 Tax=Rufibacter latericius TaxID=2487040 RepID=A0A3M9MBE8_9BACT|nr:alpha/beta hydrolase [Rufibacter latericius]RNI21898.1 alpha/beta hydrolase [Rufibacter latericius]